MLASCRVDRSWAKNTEGCSAAWRGAAGAEDADDWNPGRYLVWRARTKEIVVVELGATGDRVGLAWARAPARVPVPTAIAADRAKRFENLRLEEPAARRPREDAAAVVRRVADAVAAVGLGSIEGLSLCVCPPISQAKRRARGLLNALLGAGARRARIEDATLCAVAGAGVAPPCVVLDVGATASIAVPVDRDGRVPDAVREGAHNIHSHAYTRLRHVGFDGVVAALARTAGIEDLNKAEEAVRALAYCRHVSPAMLYNLAPKNSSFARRRTVCRALASSASRRSSPSQRGSSSSCARRRRPRRRRRRRLWSPAAGRPCEASAGASGASCPGEGGRSTRTTTPDGTSSGAAPPGWRAATAGPTTGGGRRSTRSSRPSGGRRSSKGGFKAAFRREIAPD